MDCREDKEKIRMLFTLLLIVVTATLGEDTHTTVRRRGTWGKCVPPPSGLAGSGSQEEVSNMLHVLWGHCPSPIHTYTVHVYV